MSVKSRRICLLLCCTAGIVMMLLGAARGEMTTVWRKAATVCLECIGIG